MTPITSALSQKKWPPEPLQVPRLNDPHFLTTRHQDNCAIDADGLSCWGIHHAPKDNPLKEFINPRLVGMGAYRF